MNVTIIINLAWLGLVAGFGFARWSELRVDVDPWTLSAAFLLLGASLPLSWWAMAMVLEDAHDPDADPTMDYGSPPHDFAKWDE